MYGQRVYALIPQRLLAQALGVSQRTISNYIKAGMPSHDTSEAKAWIAGRAAAVKNRKRRGRGRPWGS
jgi:hypothetical protein